jgi:hypothetical protein
VGIEGVGVLLPPLLEPPLELIDVHFAYKVISVKTPGAYGNEIAEPPSVADQPANVNPDLVGAVGSETVPPLAYVPADTDDPLFEVKVTTWLDAVQPAYKVMSFATPGE